MLQAFFYSPFSLLSREITPELRVLEKQHLECYLKSKRVFQVGKKPLCTLLIVFYRMQHRSSGRGGSTNVSFVVQVSSFSFSFLSKIDFIVLGHDK